MKLIKTQLSETSAENPPSTTGRTIDRRTFLRNAGLAAGGSAMFSALPLSMMQKAKATAATNTDTEKVKQVGSVTIVQ